MQKHIKKTVPSGAKVASIKSIGGKTIVWNQLIRNIQDNYSTDGVSIENVDGGGFKLTGTSTENIYFTLLTEKSFAKGHKYYIYLDGTDINGISLDDSYNGRFTCKTKILFEKTIDEKTYLAIRVSAGINIDRVIRPRMHDLTQMFGSGNEPSTPEEFEAMFPADQYPYNAGELMSAPVNEVIYLDTKSQETSYPIPQAILNLPGYGWSAGDVRNEVNWENKQYHKRVGKVDLGTLKYRYDPNNIRFIAGLADVLTKDKNDKINCISTFYTAASGDIFDNSKETDLIIRVDENVNQIYIRNLSYADATTFKNAMSGVILYYELAEEQITDISNLIGDTLQEPIEVEAGGTLTFKNSNGDNYRIPVSSSEEYLVSLAEVAK